MLNKSSLPLDSRSSELSPGSLIQLIIFTKCNQTTFSDGCRGRRILNGASPLKNRFGVPHSLYGILFRIPRSRNRYESREHVVSTAQSENLTSTACKNLTSMESRLSNNGSLRFSFAPLGFGRRTSVPVEIRRTVVLIATNSVS